MSCEHGGNRVPARYAQRFRSARRALAGHRGWDPGALALAQELARRLDAPLFAARTSRLLVDLNRSPTHPGVFSEWTRPLPSAERAQLLARWHHPHRRALHAAIARETRRGRRVLHVAVHSFTPELDGRRRDADVGLLYDPGRRVERELAVRWQRALSARDPRLRVRRNYPYRGVSDGATRWLRSLLPARLYAGVELELNQRAWTSRGGWPGEWVEALDASLREAALR